MKELDYWMLNTVHDALQKQHHAYCKADNQIAFILEKEGFDAARTLQHEMESNRFHPLGQIAKTMKRIEEMREEITSNVLKLNRNHDTENTKI